MEPGAKPAKAKIEARPSIRRKTRKVDGRTRDERLAEALAQLTAISEILRVISASPTDVQPVLEAIAQRAAHLCQAPFSRILIVDGSVVNVVADYSVEGESPIPSSPVPLKRTSISGRAVLDRETVHHADILPLLDSEFPDAGQNPQRAGQRAVLAVPLVRDDVAYGAIFLWRRTPGLFSSDQVALVETFAQQVAIAIDNVRLFRETKEALEQQTATSEILRVISASPTDVQPVFDTIAATALKLCQGSTATVTTFDGKLVHLGALANFAPEGADAVRQLFPQPPSRDIGSSRAILTGRVVSIPDVLDDPDFSRPTAVAGNIRSALAVPLLREERPIGAIGVGRPEPGPFPAKQINLLQTFADQAVIAIENVRLFKELDAKNRDLTRTLEQQTATAEILRVISSSPTDVQPVFDAMVTAGRRLVDGYSCAVRLLEGDELRLAAFTSTGASGDEAIRSRSSVLVSAEPVYEQAFRDRAPVFVADMANDPRVTSGWLEQSRRRGYRSMLCVPMLREGSVIGVIAVSRREPGPFAEDEIALFNTFADQAVIAIENVRLFNETKEALEQQTATAEILQAISGSPGNLRPVLDTLARAAAKFCQAPNVLIMRLENEVLHGVAAVGPFADVLRSGVDSIEAIEIAATKGTVSGRAVIERRSIHVHDLAAESEDEYPLALQFQRRWGHRTCAAAPLLREGVPLGVIDLFRTEVRPFSDKQLRSLRVFADQAVVAIENVRLFNELKVRTAELTQSVKELRALGEVGQAVSSTLDLETVLRTIVSRATQLAGMDGGSIWEYDEAREEFHLHATDRLPNELVEVLRASPIRKGEGALGRLAMTGEPVEIQDFVNEPSYQSRLREILIRCGYRSVLAVPLLREDHLLGALAVNRSSPGGFAPEVTELLKAFATQSVLAIQNARLFRQIEDKSRQLEAASQHKSQFLASMSHELRTPLNAILGFNEMILGEVYGPVPADMMEPLQDIQSSGKHLLGLINNVLDLAKIEAGRMELALADYSVQDMVESVRATLKPLAADKGLEFVVTVPPDIPLAYGDSGRITQCLVNLAGNSLKFTKAGRVEVSVEHRDGLLTCRVSDTGIGIPADKIASLFTEFKQTDATIASEYGGSGLGLSITKKFVEMHGGRIWVESELSKGSTFIFEFPLRAREKAAA